MIFVDEMKNMKIYKRPFFLPYNDADKKHGSLIYLLTPNYPSSRALMNSKLTINRKYFESYYMERNAAYYMHSNASEKALEESASILEHSDYIVDGINYDAFAEYHLEPYAENTELSEYASVEYSDSILNEMKSKRLENGFYSVYTHEMGKTTPVHLGVVEVLLVEYTEYKAIYKWVSHDDFELDNTINESVSSEEEYMERFMKLTRHQDVQVLSEAKMIDNAIQKRWNIVSNDGANNACVSVSGYEKSLRGRSSMIVFRDGKIFCRKNKDGSVNMPGGGWEPGEDPINAAIRETREEAKINVKNVKHCGTLIEYFDNVAPWVKDNVNDPNDWWYGYYSAVYCGEYDSDYTGDIPAIDQDSIETEGDWYDIDEVYPLLDNDYKAAVNVYREAMKEDAVTFTTGMEDRNVKWYPIDKEVLDKYKDSIEGLSKVKLTPNNSGYIFIDADSHQPVGYIFIEDKGGNKWVQALEVMPDFQKHGYGKDLLQFAQNQGANFLSVDKDNDIALHMFEKHGWTISGGTEALHFMIHEEAPVVDIPTPEIPDIAKQLKNKAITLRKRGRKGLYQLNKFARDLVSDLPTADDIMASSHNTSSEEDEDKEETTSEMAHVPNYTNSCFVMEDCVMMLDEADSTNDTYIKRALYNERMRTSKEQLLLLKKIKAENTWIKYAFPTNFDRYQKRNVFYDLSYYLEVYFRNAQMYKMNKGLKIFGDFLERLLDPSRIPNYYTKKTVFIPINDWDLNRATRMWIYREGINVISLLFDLMLNNMSRAKKIFGNMDIVFFGNGNYFKLNFKELTPQEEKVLANRFKLFVKKIHDNEPFTADEVDDAPDEESAKVIVTNIADKLEKNRGIKLSTQSKMIAAVATPTVTAFALTGKPIKDASTAGVRAASMAKGLTTKKPGAVDVKPITRKADDKDEVKDVAKQIVDKTTSAAVPKEGKAEKEQDVEAVERKKTELISQITQAAKQAKNTDDAIALMSDDDNDRLKELILDLEDEDQDVSMTKARAARMNALNDKFLEKEVKGIAIKDLIDPEKREKEVNAPLPATTIPVDSPFQDQWSDLQFINFDKKYDVNKDIMKMLQALGTKQYPIAIRDVEIQNTSTSEDYIDTYMIQTEDFRGKRYTIKLDIPKFKDGKYLILRGNKKTIQNQYFNMPILKTDVDTVQVISNYSKIFIRRFGNTVGKTVADADRLIKALRKYKGKRITFGYGDNSKIANSFEAPIDYIDIGTVYNWIKIKTDEGEYLFRFDRHEFMKEYKEKFDKVIDNSWFAYGLNPKGELIFFKTINDNTTLAGDIAAVLSYDTEFRDLYNSVAVAKKHVYSKASIMSAEVPLVVVCALNEGLTETLRKANIWYELKEKLTPADRHDIALDYVKFKDGYLVWKDGYSASLLLNGLKEIDTANYSIDDINKKSFWVESLDNFGGRLKADGLENFYECMIDPITYEVLQHYKLPTDYVTLLIYGNNLLADNKYISHGDSSSRRLRRNELIAVKVYKTLFNEAYSTYATNIRHNPNIAQFSCKQSAVIDKFLSDPTSSDLSVINCLNDVEASNAVSTKGESGMNSERSYTLDKRTYDSSMLNILGLSTGFSSNVGMTRQATINAGIDTERGYIKSIDGDTSKMDVANSLTMTEAVNPMGTTHDDPIRSGMTFIQTAKHQLRTEKSDPLLVTSGADEVMPYVVTDIFCKKAESDGKVIELEPDKYMIVQYKDGKSDYIDLSERIEKNSDGGFYVGVQLTTDLKVGNTFKANQVLAYDNKSFSKGSLGESNKLSYNVGKLAKVAVLNSDDNFEDSAMVTSRFAETLATDVIMKVDRILSKDTNIYRMAAIGTKVNQEDVLFETQTAYDEEDMNVLLRNLAGDKDQISRLGRRPVKSPTSGVVTGIKLYRTCEIEDMSESLQKLFRAYEKDAKKMAAHLKSLGIDDPTLLPSIGKLQPVGKLKNCPDSVLIEVYVKYHDIVAVGETFQLSQHTW